MKHKITTITLILLVALVLVAGTALAAPLNFRTHLSGGNEVPAVDTQAQGQAIFQVSKDGTEVQYKLIVANIDNVFASHIHLAPAGQNGPVVVSLFGAAPGGGRTDGVLVEGTFTAADLSGPLTGQPLSALVDAMQAGGTYVNVHTNPGTPSGEIRGQIR